MRSHIHSVRLVVVLLSLASVRAAAAVPSTLDVEPRIAVLVDHGLAESETLRRLVTAAGASGATQLRVLLRFQPSPLVRASSHLRVEHGVLVRTRDGEERVDAVTGDIALPPNARDDVKLSLLGHELAHVMLRLGACGPLPDRPEEERLATSVEATVLAELRRAEGRDSRGAIVAAPPACLDAPHLTR